MTCNCTSTLSKSFWIFYDTTRQHFVVTEPRNGGSELTACEGDLFVNLGTTHDCALLTFTYQTSGGPSILPMTLNGDMPCEISSGSGPPPVFYQGRFKPPAGQTRTYWWTLFTSQPTHRIRIVVSKA